MPNRRPATRKERRTSAGQKPDRATARAILDGVRRLERGLRLAARHVERVTGVSGAQLFVLQHLSEARATSLNELAGRTLTDRSSVSTVVDRLVAMGLVRRAVSPRDRRQFEMRITPKGLRTLRKAPPAPTDILIAGIRRLPRTRAAALGRTLAALNSTLGFQESELLFGSSG
jgi:DNA-binding MarR family transcriptional regulator